MPSASGGGEVYAGELGRTRTETIHFSCSCGFLFGAEVVVSIGASRDADAARRAREGTLNQVACPRCHAVWPVGVPFLYHDEERRLLVLVLPEGYRHRELEERARVLLELARDPAAIPAYARNFQTVFGAAELQALVEEVHTGRFGRVPPAADEQLAEEGEDVAEGVGDSGGRVSDFGPMATEPGAAERAGDSGGRVSDFGPMATEPGATVPSPPAASVDPAVERWILSKAPTYHVVEGGRVRLFARLAPDRLEPFSFGALTAKIQLHRLASYPLVVLSVHREGDSDAEPLAFLLDLGRVEDRSVLGALGLSFQLTLELYDLEHLPVLQREIVAPLHENVRYVVTAAEEHLASIPPGQRSFSAACEVWRSPGFDRYGERRKHDLAEDSFTLLPTPGMTKLALAIVDFWSEPDHEDFLVLVHSFPLEWWRKIRSRVVGRAVEFGLVLPPSLAQLAVAEGLARSRKDLAHRLVHAFADVAAGLKPNDLDREDVVANWRALVAECEALGVPLEGRAGDLAAIAVGAMPPGMDTTGARLRVARAGANERDPASPGGGPSRRPGTTRPFQGLPRGGHVVAGEIRPAPEPAANGPAKPTAATGVSAPPLARAGGQSAPVGAAAAGGMAAGHAAAAAHSGGTVGVAAGGTAAGHVAAVGSAGPGAASGSDLASRSTAELLALLDDKDFRRDAAIELCRRAEPGSVGPVFGAIRRMTRGEAVRVLPAVVRFGERAVPHLIDGLRSRKGFLRQGSALALGVLKSADGIEPLCDLLLSEPTDVWREVARAIGEVGAGAVMSLAARLRDPQPANDLGEPVGPKERAERIAWALAHVAHRGGRAPIETLAGGRDPVVAGAARAALELTRRARDNDAEVRGRQPARDVTVNRAFSRRFFEAMAGDAAARAAMIAAELDGEEIDLDDAEILDEDEEHLDDEDLIPG